jgi:hypothetical protein
MYSEANLINYFILELCGIVNQTESYRRRHDIQYNVSVIVMLNVNMPSFANSYCYAECHNAECRNYFLVC